ncbi:hypothetical protein ACI2KH_22150 [Roseomonas mucosa]|uniref:hypothetical protein n=1 Tax=Roseomonas mucosa TaxID=207340 RepID=UPI00384A5263
MVTVGTPVGASFTDDDLAKINDALLRGVTGAVKIRFADGREVTRRSAEELIALRNVVQESLRQNRRQGGIFARSTRARFCRD